MESKGETLVKDHLSGFLKIHNLQDSIDSIDEIVLSYVLSILEDLGDNQNAEDNIDVDQFIEMMNAYIPGFDCIDSVEVCEWMFTLSAALSKKNKGNHVSSEEETSHSDSVVKEIIGATANIPEVNGNIESFPEDKEESDDERIKLLLEMFPAACTLEVSHCLALSNGDTDGAVQLMLHRQEMGDSIVSPTKGKKKKDMVLDDSKVKEHIINRFSYVDTDTDKKTYTPTLQKGESKKLVRYLDSKVVSTRGERYTEIKKDDSEEMKKTYINLKPARKYRFH